MEDTAIYDSKKTLSAGSSSSSSIEPKIIVIPHAILESKHPEETTIVDPAAFSVDVEKADGVVIVDEKNASNGKGKEKLVLNNFAGHEVDSLDGVIPSPQANEIFEESIVPELSASASTASSKHVVPPSSSSLSGTQTRSNVNDLKEDHSKAVKSKSLFKSLFSKSCFMSKFACFGTKLTSSSRRATPSHVKMHASPSAVATEQPSPIDWTEDARFRSNSAEFPPPSVDGLSDSGHSLLNKLEFKKFDILEDHAGHFFGVTNKCSNPSKEWVSYIADEWRMLENDLPDTIYVRAYEARMDLLRAVMVGAEGTPYHDGLYFFDFQFPASYPKIPPAVKYHSHGLKINPTLYRSGEVCLSLLGTLNGAENESWRPYQSNMLQVLVSIQGLVLNVEPFFDEKMSEKSFKEQIFTDSLKTMLYTMSNPPKHFEDFVNGHFYMHAHDILGACRAYLDGVEVGCYLKGNPQTIAPGNIKKCSLYFKGILPCYIKALVQAFTKIGVKDCEKYLIPGDKYEAGASAGIPNI